MFRNESIHKFAKFMKLSKFILSWFYYSEKSKCTHLISWLCFAIPTSLTPTSHPIFGHLELNELTKFGAKIHDANSY